MHDQVRVRRGSVWSSSTPVAVRVHRQLVRSLPDDLLSADREEEEQDRDHRMLSIVNAPPSSTGHRRRRCADQHAETACVSARLGDSAEQLRREQDAREHERRRDEERDLDTAIACRSWSACSRAIATAYPPRRAPCARKTMPMNLGPKRLARAFAAPTRSRSSRRARTDAPTRLAAAFARLTRAFVPNLHREADTRKRSGVFSRNTVGRGAARRVPVGSLSVDRQWQDPVGGTR